MGFYWKSWAFIFCLKQEISAVIKDSERHEQEQYTHTNGLSTLHKFVAGFAACDNFNQKEEYVTTIECRDGKEIHKG